MAGYTRTTRICPVTQIHSDLLPLVQDFFQAHQVGDPETATLLCCETISTLPTPSKLGGWLAGNPDTKIHLAILLTAEWLVWARAGDQTGMVATGARLQVMKAKAFVRRPSQDMELEIAGFLAGTKEYMRGNLELSPDAAAQKFCEAVVQAVSNAAPPTKKRFFGLINN